MEKNGKKNSMEKKYSNFGALLGPIFWKLGQINWKKFLFSLVI